MRNTLTVSVKTFNEMISDLVASGVTWEAIEDKDGDIVITFTGGY